MGNHKKYRIKSLYDNKLQVAIDNAKRKFAVDLTSEIKRINKDMNITENGLPNFWLVTKKDNRKVRNDHERKEKIKKNKDKIRAKINSDLVCPMNYLYNIKFDFYKEAGIYSLPMEYFFIHHMPQKTDYKKNKKVEELIEKYSYELHLIYINDDNYLENADLFTLAENDFNELIEDIRSIYISSNYKYLMSWLINRAFHLKWKSETVTDKNKSLLLKVLYTISPEVFLECFKGV